MLRRHPHHLKEANMPVYQGKKEERRASPIFRPHIRSLSYDFL